MATIVVGIDLDLNATHTSKKGPLVGSIVFLYPVNVKAAMDPLNIELSMLSKKEWNKCAKVKTKVHSGGVAVTSPDIQDAG